MYGGSKFLSNGPVRQSLQDRGQQWLRDTRLRWVRQLACYHLPPNATHHPFPQCAPHHMCAWNNRVWVCVWFSSGNVHKPSIAGRLSCAQQCQFYFTDEKISHGTAIFRSQKLCLAGPLLRNFQLRHTFRRFDEEQKRRWKRERHAIVLSERQARNIVR